MILDNIIFSHQICAVLAAVSDVIKANGGQDTETEYFAALVGINNSCIW